MSTIPNSIALRAIRLRHINGSSAQETHADRGALLALLDDIIGQAHEGCFIEHECPALFACTYIIAQTCEPESQP